jgi:hypothetical protein
VTKKTGEPGMSKSQKEEAAKCRYSKVATFRISSFEVQAGDS